jgi:hypothetical protein
MVFEIRQRRLQESIAVDQTVLRSSKAQALKLADAYVQIGGSTIQSWSMVHPLIQRTSMTEAQEHLYCTVVLFLSQQHRI